MKRRIIDLGAVTATDDRGGQYEKIVELHIYDDGSNILSFGWPCEYELNRFAESLHRPDIDDNTPFIIDISGCNHRMIPGVSLQVGEVKRFITLAKEKLREHKQQQQKSQ